MASSTISREAIAEDFKTAMAGKMDTDLINSAAESLLTTATRYPAVGSVASFIFYLQFQVTIKEPDGRTFDGKAGGVSTPGGGALFGDVYTDDLPRLYRETSRFEFQGTPVYLSILFFNDHSNLLGSFQAGAVSTVTGVGGGSGNWH